MELVKEPAQARRGLDYVVASFFAASERKQQLQFNELCDICEEIAPNWHFTESGASPHYERVFRNDLGARIELTTVGAVGHRNCASACLSLPGTLWWLQSDEEAAFRLLQLSKIDGFKHFTRIDFQNTELNPEFDVYEVRKAVNAGEVWVNGATTFRDYMDRDAEGEPLNGLTLYWGSKRSEKLGRSYDKAASSSWKTPAIRDEVQTRGRWAKAHGQALVAELADAHGSPEMVEIVHKHTCSALNQHLAYWQLNGTNPKTDKNWKRKAEPADWYTRRIGKRCEPLQKGSGPVVDLDTTVDYGVQQYGRYFARWVDEQAKEHGLDEEFVVRALMLRFKSRLKPEDEAWLLKGLSPEEAKAKLDDLEDLKDAIARSQEVGWWGGGE